MTADKKQFFLTIPCHWDKKMLKPLLRVNGGSGIKISEVYGSLAFSPIGHGRAPESVVFVSRKDAILFKKFLDKNDVDFVYLMNAPLSEQFIKEGRREFKEYIQWVLNKLKPAAITVSSLPLAEYIRGLDKKIGIHISTIAGIKNADDCKKFLAIRPNRVVPHHDCGKRWGDLKLIIELGYKNGFDVELLVTESCLFGCQRRAAHYADLALKKADRSFHTVCNTQKLIHPREFFLAGGFVRPEDINFFADLGVKYFKISGRSKPKKWLPLVVRAYQRGRFTGNAIRLMGIDPVLKAEKLIYLDNKALDGFLLNFPQNGTIKDVVKYCEKWAVKLYQKRKFFIRDGTTYKVDGGLLKIDKIGPKVDRIITNECRFV